MGTVTDDFLCPMAVPVRTDQRRDLKALSKATGEPMAVHIRAAIDAYLMQQKAEATR